MCHIILVELSHLGRASGTATALGYCRRALAKASMRSRKFKPKRTRIPMHALHTIILIGLVAVAFGKAGW